eukprot:2290902-Amphidinium_carterae.1
MKKGHALRCVSKEELELRGGPFPSLCRLWLVERRPSVWNEARPESLDAIRQRTSSSSMAQSHFWQENHTQCWRFLPNLGLETLRRAQQEMQLFRRAGKILFVIIGMTWLGSLVFEWAFTPIDFLSVHKVLAHPKVQPNR